ncbi:MAG TPA: hypothetical protein VKZ84_08050, partial [Bacteriovoracaceae bacterium]|nr:hypothetical protein [Bacteriovoracaceae bacterium]
YAQFDEQVLNSDPIHVDGYLAEDRPVMDGELAGIRNELKKQKTSTQLNKEKSKDLSKLTNQTEKLLDSQDEYIESKIESTMAIKEFNKKVEENQKKLRCIMEESTDRECEPYMKRYQKKAKEAVEQQEVNTQQAAPVIQKTVEAAPEKKTFESIKVLPYAGGTSYNGEKEELEASLSAGLKIEANISDRVALGVGFNFSQLSTEDFANSMFTNTNWNPGYYNHFGQQGREIQFKTMGLDLYGKFFITKGERFRPYIGAGVGINRADLKYAQNNSWSYGYNNFGNENYKTTYVTGNVSLGTEIMITPSFGLNFEANYLTGLGGSFGNDESKNPFYNPDQRRLKELGDEILSAHALSIFVGAIVAF